MNACGFLVHRFPLKCAFLFVLYAFSATIRCERNGKGALPQKVVSFSGQQLISIAAQKVVHSNPQAHYRSFHLFATFHLEHIASHKKQSTNTYTVYVS